MLRAAEASLLSPDHAPPSAGTAGQASAAVNQAAVVKEKLRQKMKQQAMQSLEMPAPKIASEFYTEAEMASFKKVKKKVSTAATQVQQKSRISMFITAIYDARSE